MEVVQQDYIQFNKGSAINSFQIYPPQSQSKDATVYPCAYFDGAAQHGSCACGVFIIIEEGQVYDIHWNGGVGTNNKV